MRRPAADDEQVVGGVLELAHQVARDEHRPAFLGERPEEAADPADALRVEPVDGLVEEQHRRVAEERGGDAEPLRHAQREAADPPACGPGQADELEHCVDSSSRDAVARGHPAQVLARGAAGMKRPGVEQRPDLPQWDVERRVRPAVDEGRAPVGRVEAEDEPHRGRLAGAVRPDEARHPARLDGEGQPVDGERGAVALAEPVKFDGGLHGSDGTTRRRVSHRAREPSFTTPVTVKASSRATLGREAEDRGPGRRATTVPGGQ